jgi:hypothetical protein
MEKLSVNLRNEVSVIGGVIPIALKAEPPVAADHSSG